MKRLSIQLYNTKKGESLTLPFGIFVICRITAITPKSNTSAAIGSSTAAFFCEATTIVPPKLVAASTAATDFSRPTSHVIKVSGISTLPLKISNGYSSAPFCATVFSLSSVFVFISLSSLSQYRYKGNIF